VGFESRNDYSHRLGWGAGPMGVSRPFSPPPFENETGDRIARALEHIAVALSAIDHNLEVLVSRMPQAR
jgi:hypothetical protein